MNLYEYASNTPNTYIDPKGLSENQAWIDMVGISDMIYSNTEIYNNFVPMKGQLSLFDNPWKKNISANSRIFGRFNKAIFVTRASKFCFNLFIGEIKALHGGYIYEPEEDVVDILKSAPFGVGIVVSSLDFANASWNSLKELW